MSTHDDCCTGQAVSTPVRLHNRAGLTAVAYRVGTHGQFLESMLARLADRSERPALAGLNTREDDFSIALLDAWATVADVLTFYQERIANESYLRTASERVSVRHLAALIGYHLRPGVAATTYLAFTLDESSDPVTIDVGTQAQSLPGKDQLPQPFETVEAIEARPEWNALKPKLTHRHPLLDPADWRVRTTFYFAGTGTKLRVGDGVLVRPQAEVKPVFGTIARVTIEADQNRTRVDLTLPQRGGSYVQTNFPVGVFQPNEVVQKLRQSGPLWPDIELTNRARVDNFDLDAAFGHLAAVQPPSPTLTVFRARAAIFGHNAPTWASLPVSLRIGETDPNNRQQVIPGPYANRQNTWVDNTTLANYPGESQRRIPLDNTYDSMTGGSEIVLLDGTTWQHYNVSAAEPASKSDFTLNAKITRLMVDRTADLNKFKIRSTTVYGDSDTLELARLPVEGDVSGSEIMLDGWVAGLRIGQSIIVMGERADQRGSHAAEHGVIKDIQHDINDDGGTTLYLENGLQHPYVRTTVTINANVAQATHGASQSEVLGSGDSSQTYQQFTLSHNPLTHISAATPSGTESTLEVRVNNLLWRAANNLAQLDADDRRYIVRQTDDGKTRITFGDGKHGLRPPTGMENIRASYRSGLGQVGNVAADKIMLLARRPLGVRSVTNPIAASGGDDSEEIDNARRNTPLTVLTLDRVVSLQDYEDFTRAFAGVSKALATWTWFGQTRGIFITIAGPDGATISETSETYTNLLGALRESGDAHVPLRVASYRPARFRLSARLSIDPIYVRADVLTAAETALRRAYRFAARQFGQAVTLSQTYAILQQVAGVTAVEIQQLYRSSEPPALNARLIAAAPQAGRADQQAAELLLLADQPIELGVLT